MPKRPVLATDCSTDVSGALDRYLNALPDGAVFASPASACYLVDKGITITHPLDIIGGEFKDESSTLPPRVPGRAPPALHPIVLIDQTSDVNVEGVNLVGADPSGVFDPHLVGQAGIDIRSSSNVTITNVTTLDTFGDGLTIFVAPGEGRCRNIAVDGMTITRAGRQGITPAFVTGASFTHVNINSVADSAWDFESDLPGIGSGDITISDSRWRGAVNVVEPITGPVTFTRDTGRGYFVLNDGAGSKPVYVSHSTLLLPAYDNGYPAAGVVVDGGSLTFSDDHLGRIPSWTAPTGPAWHVNANGHLTFTHSVVDAPLGSASRGSVVTFTP